MYRERGVGRGHGLRSFRLSWSRCRIYGRKEEKFGWNGIAFCDGAFSSCRSFLSMLACCCGRCPFQEVSVISCSIVCLRLSDQAAVVALASHLLRWSDPSALLSRSLTLPAPILPRPRCVVMLHYNTRASSLRRVSFFPCSIS